MSPGLCADGTVCVSISPLFAVRSGATSKTPGRFGAAASVLVKLALRASVLVGVNASPLRSSEEGLKYFGRSSIADPTAGS